VEAKKRSFVVAAANLLERTDRAAFISCCGYRYTLPFSLNEGRRSQSRKHGSGRAGFMRVTILRRLPCWRASTLALVGRALSQFTTDEGGESRKYAVRPVSSVCGKLTLAAGGFPERSIQKTDVSRR
jgi:hypothetical protein